MPAAEITLEQIPLDKFVTDAPSVNRQTDRMGIGTLGFHNRLS